MFQLIMDSDGGISMRCMTTEWLFHEGKWYHEECGEVYPPTAANLNAELAKFRAILWEAV